MAGILQTGQSCSIDVRVHVAQPVGHHPHHLDRKKRDLVHKNIEPVFVQGYELTVGFGDGRRAAGVVVNQGHFSYHASRPNGLDELTVNKNIHLTFFDYVHQIAGLTLLENYMTRSKRVELLMIFE